MNKKAVISLLSKHGEQERETEQDDIIEVVTPGEFFKEEDYYNVIYNETELSGMQGTTTTLKIYQEKFSLIRTGTTSTRMDFDKNKECSTLYNTPQGTLDIKIGTKDLTINVDDDGGEILVNYNVSIGGQRPQKTTLKINIKA